MYRSFVTPENKAMLTSILTHHVVAGRHDSKSLMKMAKKGGKSAELTTVAGGKLWVVRKDGKLWLKDGKGMTAGISTADVFQSNGVIHVIDTVVMDK